MLNAMSQGNDGSLSTIHTRSARDTFNRLGMLAIQAEETLRPEATAQLVASGLDLIVFLKKSYGSGEDARRSVREILELNGFDGKQTLASSLFVDDDSGTARRNVDVALSPQRAEAMTRAGWRPPAQEWD